MTLLVFLLLRSDTNDYIFILKQFLLQYLENMKKIFTSTICRKIIFFKVILLNGVQFPNSF